MGKYKKRNKGNITNALIKEETKHNHIIPDRIQHKLKKSGKESFLLIKKKKKKPCDKKKGYFDLTEVNKVIARRQAAQPSLYLRSYKCDFCRKYHITSMTEEENAKRVLMFDAMTDKNISKRKIQLLK